MKSGNYNRTIRTAEAKDRAQLEELWKHCFHDTDAFTKFYFDWVFPYNRVWICEEDGRILGQLHENEYDLMLFGEPARLPYIVGVGTHEDFRHQGIMRNLLTRTLQSAAVKKLPFVYLMPADEAIYRPFGFEMIYAQDVWEQKALRPGDTGMALLRRGEVSFAGITARELSAYISFAAAAMIGNSILEKNCDIYTQRDVNYLQRLKAMNRAEDGDFMLLYAEDSPAGYLSYSLEEESAEVVEFAVLPEYEDQAVSWLKEAFADMDMRVLPMAGLTAFWDAYKYPVIMGRITHIPSYLSMLRSKKDFSLVLEIEDDMLPENTGRWLWECAGGQCSVCRADDRQLDVKMDIGQLVKWTMGYGQQPENLPEMQCRLFINEIV